MERKAQRQVLQSSRSVQLVPLQIPMEQKQSSIRSGLGWATMAQGPSLPSTRNLQSSTTLQWHQWGPGIQIYRGHFTAIPATEGCIFQPALSSKKTVVDASKRIQKTRVMMRLTSERKRVAWGKPAKPQADAELSRNWVRRVRLQEREWAGWPINGTSYHGNASPGPVPTGWVIWL